VIRVQGARSSPNELRLETGSCTIGAGSGVDIIVSDDTVSRRHVELTLVPAGVALRDLDSSNGTFYLGQRVEKMVLSLGSRIRIGSVDVAIDTDTESLLATPEGDDSYRGLLGRSQSMRKLFAMLARLEGSLVSVLIQGESGVGKELVARAIHGGSMIAEGPLVVVNCGAIDRELARSELFGHRKGAFTGASDDRAGAFETADGGTLFLDEIGELPLNVQPVLLRAIESGEVKRVGDDRARHVKVRLLAATNRGLEDAVRCGDFREDLYYRLAVVKLTVPSVKERLEDVPLLANHFAAAAGARELPEPIIAQMKEHSWPGNVRELRNAVHSHLAVGSLPDALNVSDTSLLELALEQGIDASRPYQEQRDEVIARFSRVYFRMVLARTGGNQSEAARVSGIDRSYLRRLLSKYEVEG